MCTRHKKISRQNKKTRLKRWICSNRPTRPRRWASAAATCCWRYWHLSAVGAFTPLNLLGQQKVSVSQRKSQQLWQTGQSTGSVIVWRKVVKVYSYCQQQPVSAGQFSASLCGADLSRLNDVLLVTCENCYSIIKLICDDCDDWK